MTKTSFSKDMSPAAIGWRLDSPILRTAYFADMVRDREEQIVALEQVLSQIHAAFSILRNGVPEDVEVSEFMSRIHAELETVLDTLAAKIEDEDAISGALDPFGRQSSALRSACGHFAQETASILGPWTTRKSGVAA